MEERTPVTLSLRVYFFILGVFMVRLLRVSCERLMEASNFLKISWYRSWFKIGDGDDGDGYGDPSSVTTYPTP